MNFELSEVQTDIKSAAREFAEGEFPDLKAEISWDEFPREQWRKACELGFIGMDIPEEYEGPGFGILENVLVIEEFHKVNPRIASTILSSGMGRRAILKFGTEKQKRKYLSQLASGEVRIGTYPGAEEFQIHEFPSVEFDGEEGSLRGEIEIRAEEVPDYILILCLTAQEKDRPEERFTRIILDLDRVQIEKETQTEPEKRPIHKVSLDGVEVSPK